MTAQGLISCKRARPDISPVIAYLTTRVREPNEDDWKKLVRMIKYLDQTKQDCLTLKATKDTVARWFVDAAFAVHPDQKSHTGYYMTLGSGAVISSSKKQKLNTRNSTEAELVATDDAAGPMLWTSRFLLEQGRSLTPAQFARTSLSVRTVAFACVMKTSCREATAFRANGITNPVVSCCFLLLLLASCWLRRCVEERFACWSCWGLM